MRAINVREGGDRPCDAEDLGVVPEGGTVGTIGPRSNFCATRTRDPNTFAFQSQRTVWFSFRAPASGHVEVTVTPDNSVYPLDGQVAVFETFNGACNGKLQELGSQYSLEEPSETLEVSCLYAGATYFVMIDGFGRDGVGTFQLQLRDAGDATPLTEWDTTLCAGDTLRVGHSAYTTSGNYTDTLQIEAGCDSIVLTRLTVLEPIRAGLEQVGKAVWPRANGRARVNPAGGAGGYSFAWCNGSQAAEVDDLEAGSDCCVTVTDQLGCRAEDCLELAFITQIRPSGSGDALRCAGDANGAISFRVTNGIAPYRYRWSNDGGDLQGEGRLATDGEEAILDGLTAGNYSITIEDDFGDTTITLAITEPDPLVIDTLALEAASCFGACDGRLEAAGRGGKLPYRYSWKGDRPPTAVQQNLCAGNYVLELSDTNGCRTSAPFTIQEPPEFIADAREVRPVSCFGGSDGQAEVITNGNPQAFLWSTGDEQAAVTTLPAGVYGVTATNEDGCQAEDSVNITQPAAPLEAVIRELTPVSCFGAADAVLEAEISGPWESLTYNWNTGADRPTLSGLPAGNYQLNVRNEKGCSAAAAYNLSQPQQITAELIAPALTCLEPENGGDIRLTGVSGGQPGYRYALAGGNLQDAPVFSPLTAGAYAVTVQDASGCARTFSATIDPPPTIRVELGRDREIRLGDSLRLSAKANSEHLRYEWEGPEGRFFSANPDFTVRPLRTSVYRVRVEDTTNFCTATDRIRIGVDRTRRVYIPNAFSPNDDGSNDVFMIYGRTGVAEVQYLRIFNRHGSLVYAAENFMPDDPSVGWTGHFQGKRLSAGVYVYAAKIEFVDGASEVFGGEVLLVR